MSLFPWCQDDDTTPEEWDVFNKLQDRIKFSGKNKSTQALITKCLASDLETMNVTKAPPRLVIVMNANGTKAGCAIISEAKTIHVSDNLTEALTDLLFCYYVWDLSYPKTYQLLGYMQQFILGDTKNQLFTSSTYVRFVKAME